MESVMSIHERRSLATMCRRLRALRRGFRSIADGGVVVYDPTPLVFLIVECDDETSLIDAYGHAMNGGNPDTEDDRGMVHPLAGDLEAEILEQGGLAVAMMELLSIEYQGGHDVSLVCVETATGSFLTIYRPDQVPAFQSIATGSRDEDVLRSVVEECDLTLPFLDDSPWRNVAQVRKCSEHLTSEMAVAIVRQMTGTTLPAELIGELPRSETRRRPFSSSPRGSQT